MIRSSSVAPPPRLPPSQSPDTAEPPTAYGRPFWLGYLGNLLAMVGISLLYRFADFVTLLGGSEYELGWIVGVGMVGSLAARLMIGVRIDQHGPRLIWLCSLVLLAVACFANVAITSCHAPAIYLLRILFCCALAGMFGASITFVAIRAPAARVAEMVGMLGTAGFLGAVIGTQLGDVLLNTGTIERWQTDRMFILAGLLGLLALPFVYLATRGQPRPRKPQRPPAWRLLRQYHPGMVLLVGTAMGMGLCLPSTFLRTYTDELGISRMGLFFGIYAPAAIITRVVTRRWPERFGPEPMIVVGIFGLVASQLSLLLVSAEWHLLLPGIGYGIFHAMLFPSVIAAGTRKFPDEHRGLANTLVLATWDVGALIGAPAAGALLQYSGQLGLPSYPTMFITIAALMALVGISYAFTCRRLLPTAGCQLPIVVDRPSQPLRKVDLGLVAEQAAGERDVGQAFAHVAGPRLGVLRLDVGAQQPIEQGDQREEVRAAAAGDVENTPGRVRGIGGQ